MVVGEVNEKYLSGNFYNSFDEKLGTFIILDIDPELTEMASEIARRRKTKVMSSTATVTFYIE